VYIKKYKNVHVLVWKDASGLVFVRYLCLSYRPEGCEEAHNKSCRYS